MNTDEQKNTDTKHCNRCKNELDISHFIRDDNEFIVCDICINHIKTKNLRNICHICGNPAIFNIPALKYGKLCSQHKETGMINTKSKRCKKESCNKIPTYNYIGEQIAVYCKEHYEIGMVDVKHSRCQQEGCNKRPSFNNKGELKAIYCKQHMEFGMVDITHNICKNIECNIRANFNNKGELKPIFCKTHAEPTMINIVDKKCQKEQCNKQPSFNRIGESKGIFCKEHAETDMICVTINRCQREGCNKIPSFNKIGESKRIFCKEHAESYMVDISHGKCQTELCNKRASFNKPVEKHGIFCKDHAEPDMICVTINRCLQEGCNKIPSFNKEGESVGIYCKDHSESDMIDVKHKKCIIDNCNTRNLYGYCGQSPIYCGKHRDLHKDKNFLYKQPKRRCIGNDDEDCKNISEYGKTEPIHCLSHKSEDDIHLVAQKCTQCCNNDLLNKEGLCITYCAPNKLYQQVKQEKKKEKLVLSYLDKNVKIENIINIQDDRVINTFCNHYRPDRMYDVGSHCIIIEIDEDQHKGKRASCSKGEVGELSRMHEIQNAIGINCIFLRFNPDSFKVNGKLHKVNMNERLKLLVKWIERCVEMKPELNIQPVKYKYLYYDEWSETDTSFKEIDDTELYDK